MEEVKNEKETQVTEEVKEEAKTEEVNEEATAEEVKEEESTLAEAVADKKKAGKLLQLINYLRCILK